MEQTDNWSITVTDIYGVAQTIYEGTEQACKDLFGDYRRWNNADKNDRDEWSPLDMIITNETTVQPGKWGKPVNLHRPNGAVVSTIK